MTYLDPKRGGVVDSCGSVGRLTGVRPRVMLAQPVEDQRLGFGVCEHSNVVTGTVHNTSS